MSNQLAQIDEAPLPARTKSDFENTKIGVHIGSVDEALTLAKAFAASGLFKDVKDASQCVAKIMMGAEFGISPVAAMNGIHIVQGKMQLSGIMIATLIKRHPNYSYRNRELTNEAAEIEFFEDGESIGTERFTKEDATRQGTQNMAKFPKNMLWNRAMSNGAKFYCPDVFGGMPIYTEGEFDETPEPPAPTGGKADQIKAQFAARSAPALESNASPAEFVEPPTPPVNRIDAEAESDAWFRSMQPLSSDLDWLADLSETDPDWGIRLVEARAAGCTGTEQVIQYVDNGIVPTPNEGQEALL